jgi:hypothetical protein
VKERGKREGGRNTKNSENGATSHSLIIS